eukprot:scpid39125/ scgid3532/ 
MCISMSIECVHLTMSMSCSPAQQVLLSLNYGQLEGPVGMVLDSCGASKTSALPPLHCSSEIEEWHMQPCHARIYVSHASYAIHWQCVVALCSAVPCKEKEQEICTFSHPDIAGFE